MVSGDLCRPASACPPHLLSCPPPTPSPPSQSLKQLGVADNLLEELPAGLGRLPALQKLWAYGNRLSGTQAVRCLSRSSSDGLVPADILASNGDSSDDTGNSGDTGSDGTGSSGGVRPLWSCLDSVWLEGNPLVPQAVLELLMCVPELPHLKSMGLDLTQVCGGEGWGNVAVRERGGRMCSNIFPPI